MKKIVDCISNKLSELLIVISYHLFEGVIITLMIKEGGFSRLVNTTKLHYPGFALFYTHQSRGYDESSRQQQRQSLLVGCDASNAKTSKLKEMAKGN